MREVASEAARTKGTEALVAGRFVEQGQIYGTALSVDIE